MTTPTSSPADPHATTSPKKALRRLIWATIGTFVLSLIMLALGILFSESRDDLWMELSRAGLQLFAVGIIGTALGFVWKQFEQSRSDRRKAEELHLEQQRERYQRQLANFIHIVDAYNGVKAVRRTLMSLGFTAGGGVLSDWQADGFHAQMSRLNELQLIFEAQLRELTESQLFESDTTVIVTELARIEKYLNRVLAIWQDHGSEIHTGTPTIVATTGLNDFLDTCRFKEGVVYPRRRLTAVMCTHLSSTAATAERLAELNNREGTQA